MRDAVGGRPVIEVGRVLKRRRRILGVAWMAAVLLAIGGGALSLALFTHQEPIDEPFTVGTISLDLSPTGTLITFSGMVPGTQVDGVLTVLNDGTGALRYAMTVEATDADAKDLRDVLQLDVERRTGCGGPILEVLYSGPLATASFGDPQPGAGPGDRVLGSGVSEALCVRATLPVGTDTLYEGSTTTATLTFWAEQVAGNP